MLLRREAGDRFVRPDRSTNWDFSIHMNDNPQLAGDAAKRLAKVSTPRQDRPDNTDTTRNEHEIADQGAVGERDHQERANEQDGSSAPNQASPLVEL